MKIFVNNSGTITEGIFKGYTGLIIDFESESNKVIVELDEITRVQIDSEYIDQSDFV